MKNIPTLIRRILFILFSSMVMVFFSEKVFWYVQGYAVLELVFYYALPAACCMWVIELFQVQRLSGMVLVGGLYGFVVEGVLTPVVYEAGLLDPVMPAYFIGWHGMLSLVLGWYLLRKCLVERRWKQTLLLSAFVGLFWGIWSLAYRLPESILEFQALGESGERFFPGAWPVKDFALYTMAFTLLLAFSHWLLGKGLWQSTFKLNKWEIGLLGTVLSVLYLAQVALIVPLGFLKLAVLIVLVVIPLRLAQVQPGEPSVLRLLDRPFPIIQLLPFALIPGMATLVYSLAELFPPPDGWLRGMYISIYSLQALAGGGFFIWAWIDSIKTHKKLKIE